MEVKKSVLFTVIMFMAVGVFCQAGEKCDSKDLKVTFDLTYTSKWMSKGVEAYGEQGGLFKTIDVDLWGSGFGFKVTHRNATVGRVDAQRFDFRPYYQNKFFEGESYQTNYNIGVGYEYYPGLSPLKANTTWEWIGAFSWPKLLSCGVVPSYIVHYEYPAYGGQANHNNVGWVHRFLLSYGIKMPDTLPNPLTVSTEVARYEGLADRGSDWAYFTVGLKTKLDITKNLTFVPGVYHQVTMDDKISKRKSITYTMLSMKYAF